MLPLCQILTESAPALGVGAIVVAAAWRLGAALGRVTTRLAAVEARLAALEAELHKRTEDSPS